MLDLLKESFERQIDQINLSSKRGLYFNFNPKRLTGLVGPRGVGKTTLLLQYIKEHLYEDRKAFYFSADAVYFRQITLLEFIDQLYKFEGIRHFFIDEIHQYKNWNQELKNIYDSFPDVRVTFSGSSMLDLIAGSYDLSRRVNFYRLPGLSFREYLSFAQSLDIPLATFETMVEDASYMNPVGQIPTILGYFKQYLQKGYYPFFFEDAETYYERIWQIIKKTIFEDIPNRYDLKTNHLHLFQKLLGYLASIPPGEVNVQNISKNIGLAHQTVESYLQMMATVGLIEMVYPYEGGSQYLRKPAKIFLHNTNLFCALQSMVGVELNKGNLRELYFLQALRDGGQTVYYSKQGDYRTAKTVFEIGGKNKTGKQLKNVSFEGKIVKDDVLAASKDSIPLFYFGFLY